MVSKMFKDKFRFFTHPMRLVTSKIYSDNLKDCAGLEAGDSFSRRQNHYWWEREEYCELYSSSKISICQGE